MISQVDVRLRFERKLGRVHPCDERVIQRLKWSQPINGVKLENLLDEIDEVEYLSPLVDPIINLDLVDVYWLGYITLV